jgi:hypothetical protein
MPKFTRAQQQAQPNLRIVGDAMGPTAMPDQMVTVYPDLLAYRDLFAYGVDGAPSRADYGGGYGSLGKAGRR